MELLRPPLLPLEVRFLEGPDQGPQAVGQAQDLGKKPARREENDWAEYEDELVLSAPAPVEDNCVTKEVA